MSLLAIFGPTGSGKTEVAVHAARELGTDVINTDPAQCYRGLPILTNQPGPEHDAIALHRMVGVWGLDEEATVARFVQEVHAQIDQLLEERGAAVLCGGSGLYLLSALTAMGFGGVGPDTQSGPDSAIRERLHREYEELGADALHARLADAQPELAQRIHPNDRKRLIRALEAIELEGTVSPGGGSIWDQPLRRPARLFGLTVERSLVRERIDHRTQEMFDAGVLDEVASVVGMRGENADRLSVTARRLHGLQDCIDALSGELSVVQAQELMATRTRQYARRQDTWARRWEQLEPVSVDLASFDGASIGTLLARVAREGARVGDIQTLAEDQA